MMWTSTRILSTTLVLSFILRGVHADSHATNDSEKKETVPTQTTIASKNSSSETQQVNSLPTTQQPNKTSVQISKGAEVTAIPGTSSTVPSSSDTLTPITQTTFMLTAALTITKSLSSDPHATQPTPHTELSTHSVTATTTLDLNNSTAIFSSTPSPTLLNSDYTNTTANTTPTNTTAPTTSNYTTYSTSDEIFEKESQNITASLPISNTTTDIITKPSNPATNQSQEFLSEVLNVTETVRNTTTQMIPTTAPTFHKGSVTSVLQQTKTTGIFTTAVDQVNKMTTAERETSMVTTEKINSVTISSSKSSINKPGSINIMTIDGSETSEDLKAKTCAKFLIQNKMGKCNMSWVEYNNGTVAITSINIIVDPAVANQFYSDFEKEKRNEDFNKTLVAIMVSCGTLVLILLAFALYCFCHCKSYRKNQQPLTEELQTVENGYHDNPTLEVMEVQPERQEKKLALNGEFNDSWIVPFDNLTKDDMLDEEDTHL